MFRKNWRSRLEELPTGKSRGFVIAPADSKTSDGAMLISCLEGILVSAVPNWQRLKDSRLVAPLLLIGRPNLARKCRFRGWDSRPLPKDSEVLCSRSLDQNLSGALAAWALTYADVSFFEGSWTVLLCETGQWQDDVH